MQTVRPDGPMPARIMIVGEAPGQEEERLGVPFVGASGQELSRMLHEAGIARSECFITNVCRVRPPNNDIENFIALKKKDVTLVHVTMRDKYVLPIVQEGAKMLEFEIEQCKPKVIIACGNVALWALTGAWGVKKWRGSELKHSSGAIVIPIWHPAAVLRMWELRAETVNDLKRAKKVLDKGSIPPDWRFVVRPSFTSVMQILEELKNEAEKEPIWIDFDLETRAGHIACAGLSWSLTDALCIPMMCTERWGGYWNEVEEAEIIFALYKLLTHSNCYVRWQNGLYDAQYTYRHWHFIPNGKQDTMISQHTMFAGLRKALDYQASMYCNWYVYWKDDGKTWTKDIGEDQLWKYNCEDCVRTREVGESELISIQSMGLAEVEAMQQVMFWPVLWAMNKGVRIDEAARSKMALELMTEMNKRENFFSQVLGHPLNPRSPKQMTTLFYKDLKLPVIKTKAKKGIPGHVSCDDKALDVLQAREPLIRPLVKSIREYRSLGVFLSTFVNASLDNDKRMRCSYNICGTETYRLSSSENAFGSGTNLQNIPKGVEAQEPEDLTLPNIRTIFIPDPGFTMFDMDLDRADLQVVVWESGDEELKAALKLGVDMHLLNAYTLAGKSLPPLDELVEGHPRYPDHRIPYKKERQLAKSFIHGTNYGGGARTMAVAAGITVEQADRFQKLYFDKYPGLRKWHERTEKQLRRFRFVENRFGYRRYYFDRIEGLLPEALAWQPQSTVAIYINKIWLRLFENVKEVQTLLQVHDSLVGQFPTHLAEWCMKKMKEEAHQVIIPYDEPLIIPVGIKTSTKSWGDCV